MAQCKKDCCREQAVPHAPKQLCREHLDAYRAKQKEQAAIRATLPDCPGPWEGRACPDRAKVRHKRVFAGEPPPKDPYFPRCPRCQQIADDQNAYERAKARKAEADRLRLSELDNCDSVEDLRQWIKGHML